jgi:hypothetical protein
MFIFSVVLAAILGVLGAIPLKAGAAYRFRGKTMLAIEGFGLWAAAVIGLVTGAVWLLVAATVVGVGITQLPNSHKRLE